MAIEEWRAAVDRSDRALKEALVSRFAATDAIGAFKKENGLPVGDAAREAAVVRALCEGLCPRDAFALRGLSERLFALSRLRQKGLGVWGLVGKGISDSLSPALHNAFWTRDYRLFDLDEPKAEAFLASRAFDGVNVTAPYKRMAAALCDELDPLAARLGSVNTIVCRDWRLIGYNTDARGFRELARRAGISLAGQRVAVVGRGGVTPAVEAVCREEGAESVRLLGRGETDAQATVLVLAAGAAEVDWDSFPGLCALLDLSYQPFRSRPVLEACERGLRSAGGLSMLVWQGVESARIFSGEEFGSPEAALERELHEAYGNLVLIGLPGVGKTTVGRALARQLGRPFWDSDEEIEKKTGCTPEDWILRDGEAAFRAVEAETVRALAGKRGAVLAVGGGAVLDRENRMALRAGGEVICLTRPPELLAREGRPLSLDLAALEKEREPYYALCRDFCIANDKSVEQTVERIRNR